MEEEHYKEDRTPLLYLEVNLAPGNLTKLLIFEGDDSKEVVDLFCKNQGLSEDKRGKLWKVV
jgi:hypothetical protein